MRTPRLPPRGRASRRSSQTAWRAGTRRGAWRTRRASRAGSSTATPSSDGRTPAAARGGHAAAGDGGGAEGTGGRGLLEELVLLVVLVLARGNGEPAVVGDGLGRVGSDTGGDGLRLERLRRRLRAVVLAPAAREHLDARRDDLRLPVALALLVVPGPGLQPALERDLLALAEVPPARLRQAVPGDDVVELRLLLPADVLVGRHGELGHRLAAGGGAELGVAREATRQEDPVHIGPCLLPIGRHVVSSRALHGRSCVRRASTSGGRERRRPLRKGALGGPTVRRGRRSRRAPRTVAAAASLSLIRDSSPACPLGILARS